MTYIVRCQFRCPHGEQCSLEAGHEPPKLTNHQPLGCGCQEKCTAARPDWDQYFMAIARIASLRGSCDRKQVGAVLVADKHVIATGYNGAPAGLPTCAEVGHQLVDMGGRQSCVRTIHAEQNAIIQCSVVGTPAMGAIVYTTAKPCLECTKAIIAAGCSGIVFADSYNSARNGDVDLQAMAAANGISWRQLA